MTSPMRSQILIRAAASADSAAIAELSGQLGYPATPREIEERLKGICGRREHGLFVAEIFPSGASPEGAAHVVGWVHVCERPVLEADLRAEVAGLVVAEEHRRSGAGRRLMERAEEWARERGCRAVMLRSNVIRAGAHAFYQALGYRAIKTQKVFLKEL